MTFFEEIFDWKDKRVSNWKKCIRIVFKHGWKDIHTRGYSSQEMARIILLAHETELDDQEKLFLKGLLV